MGAIVRTVSENQTEETIKNDIKLMQKKWEEIKSKSIENVPQKIYDKGGIVRKTIIDLIDSNLDKILVDNSENLEEVKKVLMQELIEESGKKSEEGGEGGGGKKESEEQKK